MRDIYLLKWLSIDQRPAHWVIAYNVMVIGLTSVRPGVNILVFGIKLCIILICT